MDDIRLTDAEWTVMDALWRLAKGSARDVLNLVEDDTRWAYTTVKTMLDRLTDKGVLVADRGGAAAVYRPRIDRAEARRGAARQLRDRAFGGDPASLVLCLLEDGELSAADRRELAHRLRRLEAAEDEGKGDEEEEG